MTQTSTCTIGGMHSPTGLGKSMAGRIVQRVLVAYAIVALAQVPLLLVVLTAATLYHWGWHRVVAWPTKATT